MNDKAHHMRDRFPDKRGTIDRLLAEDPEFFALSEDYDSCVDALKYWATSNASEAETRVIEYDTLIKELEEEISQYLSSVRH